MSASSIRESILVVDDSPLTVEVISRNLEARGFRVFTASRAEEAIRVLQSASIDMVITDFKMPGQSGLDLIRHIRQNYKDIETIMITGYATVEGAVDAVKTGAEEYLVKPFTDKELSAAVERAIDKLQMRRAMTTGSEDRASAPPGFIGKSSAMTRVYRDIHKASNTRATVLICGESGTGKELVARAIHYGSARAASPFVAVNCGGIPETLLESELFGYVKGAFTGATETRAGYFQTADGGTIFLDEVSEMSLAMQVKLLRALQEKEVCMVGSTRVQKIDLRIIAATNKDLMTLVNKGVFREDLFYRLNVVSIDLPPLHERNDDIILLISHFSKKYADESESGETPTFTDEALQSLRSYHWPGNIRELENVIRRLIVMTDGDIVDVPDLPSLMRSAVIRESGFDRTLADVEAEYIRNVLVSVGGNRTRAAEILGIDRKTLRKKLEQSKKGS